MKQPKKPNRQKMLILIVIVIILLLSSLLRQSREDSQETSGDGLTEIQLAVPNEQISSALQGTDLSPVSATETTADDLYSDYPTEISYTDNGIDEDGTYSSVEDVSYYLHLYGHLPDNYITKSEAEDDGWVSYEGNLWEVDYGACIGGDRFGNNEGLLPKGERYYECDVNYDGGFRGEERLIYTEDGDVYYTSDHYKTFEKLY